MKKLSAKLILMAATATCPILAKSALAQQAQAAAQAAGNDQFADIIVTAQRVASPLQKTPISITALSGETLAERAISNVQDVGSLAPNVNIASGRTTSGVAFVYVRGIGQSDDNPSVDPGVAEYVDDVYLGRISGGLLALDDVARVEVLRGPQGTLYGKNALGGAISVITNQPTDKAEGWIKARVGNYDFSSLSAMANVPITDRLFLRVSGIREKRDGYMQNLFTGGTVNRRDFWAGRAALRFKASDRADFLLSYDRSEDDSGLQTGRLIQLYPGSFPNAVAATLGSLAPYVVPRGQNPWKGGSFDLERDPLFPTPFNHSWGVSGRATINLSDTVTLKSITAYRKLDLYQIIELDASPLRAIPNGQPLDQWQISQEFQLSGSSFDHKLEWVGGVFYYKERVGFNSTAQVLAFNSAQSFSRDQNVRTDSYAAFANGTYHFTPEISLTLGGRYTSEKRGIFVQQFNQARTVVQFGPATADTRFNRFTPRASLNYQITADILAYASYTQGFKSGGFNGRGNLSGGLSPFAPEKTEAYEVGLKTAWLNRRLTLNVAGFYTNYKDLQLTVFTGSGTQFIQLIQNAGKAHIEGVEFEGTLRPTRGVQFFGNAAIMHAKYDQFLDARLGDLSSLKMIQAPHFTSDVGVRLEKDFSGRLTGNFTADYAYRSKTYLDVFNAPETVQHGFGLVNARAALILDSRFELGAFARNLTNKIYYQNAVSFATSFGWSLGYYGAPRTYGLDFTAHF